MKSKLLFLKIASLLLFVYFILLLILQSLPSLNHHTHTHRSAQFKGADQSAPYSACRGRQHHTASHGQKGTALLLPVCLVSLCTMLPPVWNTLYCSNLQLHQISLQAAKSRNTDVRVEMVSYSTNLGLSHNNIYLDPNLTNVVRCVLLKVPCYTHITAGFHH